MNISSSCISVEDDIDNIIAKLNRWPEKIEPIGIVYKDTPLFIAEACSLTALHDGCPTAEVCEYRDLEVENAQGEKFIVAHESCKSIVYGKSAFGISQHQNILMKHGISKFRIDFLTKKYSEANLHNVLNAIMLRSKVESTHPVNFERVLL